MRIPLLGLFAFLMDAMIAFALTNLFLMEFASLYQDPIIQRGVPYFVSISIGLVLMWFIIRILTGKEPLGN